MTKQLAAPLSHFEHLLQANQSPPDMSSSPKNIKIEARPYVRLRRWPWRKTRTLRRSCNACVRAKQRRDLLSSGCSRCLKKRVRFVYANEPLGARRDRAVAKQERMVAAKIIGMRRAGPFAQCSIDEMPILASRDPDLTLQQHSFPGIPLTVNLQYLSRHLISFPSMFAEHRRTPFIDLKSMTTRFRNQSRTCRQSAPPPSPALMGI